MATDNSINQDKDTEILTRRMSLVRNKLVVLSGKGGVGKSTVSVNLAAELCRRGNRVGLLDVDLHGPSIPGMLNLKGTEVRTDGEAMLPVDFRGMKVMSLGFMLESDKEPVIWRGPMKMGAIRQLLKDVVWGELDYLIIDSPPGTGDEPLSVCQLLGTVDGAVVVTTPQKVSIDDVRRSITFCAKLNMDVLGVVENMNGFVCPKCEEITYIFKSGNGKTMAEEMGVRFLGSVPIDPAVVDACDTGKPFVLDFPESAAGKCFTSIADTITQPLTEN